MRFMVSEAKINKKMYSFVYKIPVINIIIVIMIIIITAYKLMSSIKKLFEVDSYLHQKHFSSSSSSPLKFKKIVFVLEL